MGDLLQTPNKISSKSYGRIDSYYHFWFKMGASCKLPLYMLNLQIWFVSMHCVQPIKRILYDCHHNLCYLLLLSHAFRWTIRARVTRKAPIRTWSNSKGEGRLFSVDLLDESVSRNTIAISFNTLLLDYL